LLNSLTFGLKQNCKVIKTVQDVKLNFVSGSSVFGIAQTVSGEISGATGLIKTVYVSSGAWGTGDASGYLIISFCDGVFQAGENITDDGSTPGEAVLTTAKNVVDSFGASVYTTKETSSVCAFDDLANSSAGIVDYVAGKFVVRDGNLFVPKDLDVAEGDYIQGESEGFTELYKALKIARVPNIFNSEIDHIEISLEKVTKMG
jgi:hypothetical protein